MPRTVRDVKLDTRTARSRLSARKEPYWRAIDTGSHVGYYKGSKSGSWWARYRPPNSSTYVKKRFAKTDDTQDANGVDVLSFSQAQAKAREWFTARARLDAGLSPQAGPYTVSDAMRDYMDEDYGPRGKSPRDIQYRIDAFILPEFGKTETAKLTTRKIRGWHRKMAATPPRLRTRPGKEQQYQVISDDSESVRKRRHSANKVLTILKAALNFAWQESRVADAENWRRVKPFKGVDAPRVRILTDKEIKRISNACDGEFRPLVQAALLTGCRYGEITSLRVSEINLTIGSVHVRESKSGKPRDVTLTDEGCVFFSRAIAGKQTGDIVFQRNDGRRWGKSHQTRPLAKACEASRIDPAISFHILRHVYASRLAMAGTPMAVIAKQLGHADTRMAEKHYAHLSPSYVAETVRANFSELGIVESDNVESLG